MEKQNVQTMPRRQKSDVLNLFKGLACISVVFVHVHFPGITGIVVHRSFSSFAVPLFLMIAGYFAFGKDESVIKRRFFKILKLILFGISWLSIKKSIA
jgi:surface polysaccharide O-acyltransferase-like enzyme